MPLALGAGPITSKLNACRSRPTPDLGHVMLAAKALLQPLIILLRGPHVWRLEKPLQKLFLVLQPKAGLVCRLDLR